MRKFLYLMLVLQSSLIHAASMQHAKITDWLGMGSGCRGRAPNVGDLRMKLVQDPKDPLRMEVYFSMGSYALSGDKPVTPEHSSFARECSLRFAIAPQPNTRVRTIEASSSFMVAKDKGVSAEIHSRLITPKGTLIDWEKVFEKDRPVHNEKVGMLLVPNEAGKKILTETACGTPRILGADFTFENYRDSFQHKVHMAHGQPNQVKFVVYLESCDPSQGRTEKK